MGCDACTMTNNRHETKTFRCVRCEVVRWHYEGEAIYVLGLLFGYVCHECPREPVEDRRSAHKASRKVAAAPAPAAPAVTAAPMGEDAN